ncbi:hypothetical protein AM501_30520, partial [Aneurinibacillus migulanus]|uniref:hypothetical protein n=1 Tax=Aneurinibacillus migulanus TaxID=47500 RepID=UPI0006B5501A
MRKKYAFYTIITLLFIFFLLDVTLPKTYAASETYYELAPGNSAIITSPYDSSTSIYVKGNKYDYVMYNYDGSSYYYGQTETSNWYSISSGQRLIVSNTSSSTIILENSYTLLNVRSTSTPALAKKWLSPGQSLVASNKRNDSESIQIGGRNDQATYKSGTLYSYRTDDYGGSQRISTGESMAITNRDTAGYNVYGPYETVSFATRTVPAVLRWTLQPGETLQAVNHTKNSFDVHHNYISHEYARYDSQGNLSSYGTSNYSHTISPSERLIMTNPNENSMEVKFPYDAFTVSSRTLPALFKKTLQNGESLRLVNKSNKSHTLSFEGTYDFAEYNASGKVEAYNKDVTYSSRSISAGSSIVVTKTGSGRVQVIGPHDVFTVTNREKPALFTYTLAPGASMEAAYTGATSYANVTMTGKYDSALYDSSGGLQNYQYHRSPSYENVEAGKRIAVQNADVFNIVVYGAYDVFRVQG